MPTTDPILAVLRDAIRLLSDGVIVTTVDLEQPRIVLVNEALCRITGYRAEELIGNTPRLLQGPKTSSGVLATLRAALEAHHQFFGETRQLPQGRQRLSRRAADRAHERCRRRPALPAGAPSRHQPHPAHRGRAARARILVPQPARQHARHHRLPRRERRRAARLPRRRRAARPRRATDRRHAARRQGQHRAVVSQHPSGRPRRLSGGRTAAQGARRELHAGIPHLPSDHAGAALGAGDGLDRPAARTRQPLLRQLRHRHHRAEAGGGAAGRAEPHPRDDRARQAAGGDARRPHALHRGAMSRACCAPSCCSTRPGSTCSTARRRACPRPTAARSTASRSARAWAPAARRRSGAKRSWSTDTYEDPLWADYRKLAMAYELRSCWSTPIFSEQGRVLGTFAMYYRSVRSPSATEQTLIGIATHVAGIAIERRAHGSRAGRERGALPQPGGSSVPALILMADAGGQCIYVNRPWLAYTGRTIDPGVRPRLRREHSSRRSRPRRRRRDRRRSNVAPGGRPNTGSGARRAIPMTVLESAGAALQRRSRLYRPYRHPDRRDRA